MASSKRQFVTQSLDMRSFHSGETEVAPAIRDKMVERTAWIRHYIHAGIGPVFVFRTTNYITDKYRLKSIYKLNEGTYSYVYYGYDGKEYSDVTGKWSDIVIPLGGEE